MSSVLIATFDGLQQAQVTQEHMPNLAAFAGEGVTFANHHAVYPTVTRANAASMVTGRYPGGHGLAANRLVVKDFSPYTAVPALEPELAQIARTTGRVLYAPTLAQMLSTQGHEYVAIGVGTSGNAYLHNPTAEVSGGATIHPDFTLPYHLNEELLARFGAWPHETRPNTPRMAHAVRIMTEYILPERNPLVSLIWSSEPDKSQHDAGVGSELSGRAIREADEQFGKLLEWLKASGRSAETDVIVISDHGYSTVRGVIDVETRLRAAGFPPGEEKDGVTVAPNGGSVLFYTHEQDRATADRLSQWLMRQPWCGAITASAAVAGIPGCLPAALVGAEGPRAPELTMSFNWDSEPNGAGYSGHVYSTSGAPGVGQHGSMSKQELNNVLFARGPSFKTDLKITIPSGNTDLAPTVLSILGISSSEHLDGRVLREALILGPEPSTINWSQELFQAERSLADKLYRQEISISRVGDTTYVDQGCAFIDPA